MHSVAFHRRLGRRLLASSLFEALTYPHGVDRYVELVRPLLVRREVRAELTAVRRQTPRSVTLTLRPNSAWGGWGAGQFVALSVAIDGVRETRLYSLAGSQHARDGLLELTVSTHPDGKVSRFLRDRGRRGMAVGLSQAQGEFVLPEPRPERVLLISGGSGITPVIAMLRTLCDEGFEGEIGFLHYARSRELALYGPQLERLARRHERLRIARGFTRGRSRTSGRRFQPDHASAVISELGGAATFVCGPPALIDSVETSLEQNRLPKPAVESFTPSPITLDPDRVEGAVRFAASGSQAPNSGLPLLEQAEDAGLAPEHGCRMGICNSCSCRKLSGAVRNTLTGALSGHDDEQIRICVSVPVGDVALDL